MPSYIDTDALKRLITREMRAKLFRILGVERVDPVHASPKGWVRHLYMPEEIKQDTKASFSVNLDNGGVNDFGSAYSNDWYGFVMDCRNCSYPAAIRWTIRQIGNDVVLDIEQVIQNQTDKRTMRHAFPIEEVKIMSDELVNEGSTEAASLLEYLKGRGLEKSMIESARLGYHKDEDGQSWLFIPYDTEDGKVAYFKMIGFDPQGNGPSTGGWVEGKDGGKKVRTSGSARLYPTQYLQKKPVVLCEGEIDALIARQVGINALTTTAGASTFNKQFANTISKAADKVWIAYDGDEAGREGRVKAGKILVREGLTVKFCSTPDDKDINDLYLEGGKSRIVSLITGATMFDYDPDDEGDGVDMDIEKIFGFLDVEWSELAPEQKQEAIRGMQRIIAREGLTMERIAEPERGDVHVEDDRAEGGDSSSA